MILEEMNAMYTPWNFLQQPAHPDTGLTASFRTLLAALDQGWQVEEPVQVMPSARHDTWTYYFVITHPLTGLANRLFVPVLPDVELFVEHHRFQVIEGSYY